MDFIFAQKIGSSLFKIYLKSFHRKTFKLEVFSMVKCKAILLCWESNSIYFNETLN